MSFVPCGSLGAYIKRHGPPSDPLTICAVPRYLGRVAALSAVVLITWGAPVSAGDRAADAAAKGRTFLAGLFNADLGLLPEYATATTYWLFHDNYLAAKVLAGTHPQIAEAIKGALADLPRHPWTRTQREVTEQRRDIADARERQ